MSRHLLMVLRSIRADSHWAIRMRRFLVGSARHRRHRPFQQGDLSAVTPGRYAVCPPGAAVCRLVRSAPDKLLVLHVVV